LSAKQRSHRQLRGYRTSGKLLLLLGQRETLISTKAAHTTNKNKTCADINLTIASSEVWVTRSGRTHLSPRLTSPQSAVSTRVKVSRAGIMHRLNSRGTGICQLENPLLAQCSK